MHLFPYKWYLKDGYPSKNIAKNNYNVFGTFICGGGSTMGYKLAGFNHLGGVEIDPKISEVYKTNHSPKHLYEMDIRDFNKINDLPNELYNLDILDGSPPCSTFSMAGSREKAWGKEKKFSEGQALQILDDLVYIYCDTIIKLQPKVFILENVKGIIQGNAKVYSKNIVSKMIKSGYAVQVFCLNAASMGVPQKRERVFFIGHKKEFDLPKLKLEFNEKPILFSQIIDKADIQNQLTDNQFDIWKNKIKSDHSSGDVCLRIRNHSSGFTNPIIHSNEVCCTVNAQGGSFMIYDYPRHINKFEVSCVGSYPLDYNFKQVCPRYLIGMSVPPVMTAQISNQIKIQWLDKINS